MTATEKLRAAQEKHDSWVCVGLDPELKKMPKSLLAKYNIDPDQFDQNDEGQLRLAAEMYYEFCTTVVKRTAKHCCAFKPNMAFFESLGDAGLACLKRLCRFIREQCPDHFLIVDGKRNDIGNTATQYGIGYGHYRPDMVTWNPYMGNDTAEPFFQAGLGVLALCLTSNDGAQHYQHLNVIGGKWPCGGEALYMHVADRVQSDFGATGNVGLVVGATYFTDLAKIRKHVGKDMIFLIPGLKTQGGKPADVIAANDGGLAVINVSRNVLYASNGDDWADASEAEAKNTNDEVNTLRKAA